VPIKPNQKMLLAAKQIIDAPADTIEKLYRAMIHAAAGDLQLPQ
jgi:hypothetical protein